MKRSKIGLYLLQGGKVVLLLKHCFQKAVILYEIWIKQIINMLDITRAFERKTWDGALYYVKDCVDK